MQLQCQCGSLNPRAGLIDNTVIVKNFKVQGTNIFQELGQSLFVGSSRQHHKRGLRVDRNLEWLGMDLVPSDYKFGDTCVLLRLGNPVYFFVFLDQIVIKVT